MKNVKFKQFFFCLLAILSLCASSVAACSCVHHQQETAPTALSSCPEHSMDNPSVEKSENQSSTDAFDARCNCARVISPSIVKAENVKVEKHPAKICILTRNESFIVSIKEEKPIEFSKPFYLSDSFYNLAPGRAPPVL